MQQSLSVPLTSLLGKLDPSPTISSKIQPPMVPPSLKQESLVSPGSFAAQNTINPMIASLFPGNTAPGAFGGIPLTLPPVSSVGMHHAASNEPQMKPWTDPTSNQNPIPTNVSPNALKRKAVKTEMPDSTVGGMEAQFVKRERDSLESGMSSKAVKENGLKNGDSPTYRHKCKFCKKVRDLS